MQALDHTPPLLIFQLDVGLNWLVFGEMTKAALMEGTFDRGLKVFRKKFMKANGKNESK